MEDVIKRQRGTEHVKGSIAIGQYATCALLACGDASSGEGRDMLSAKNGQAASDEN